jgi:hypothetical protein
LSSAANTPTQDEKVRLESLHRNATSEEERLLAFTLLLATEDVRNLSDSLLELLKSDDPTVLRIGLDSLHYKIREGSEEEKSFLANDPAFRSRIARLGKDHGENPTIVRKVQQLEETMKGMGGMNRATGKPQSVATNADLPPVRAEANRFDTRTISPPQAQTGGKDVPPSVSLQWVWTAAPLLIVGVLSLLMALRKRSTKHRLP